MREGDYVDCRADWRDAGLPLERSAVAALRFRGRELGAGDCPSDPARGDTEIVTKGRRFLRNAGAPAGIRRDS